MATNYYYDGHTKVLGVDTSSDPSELSSRIVTESVNRAFRGSRNQTRPPFRSMNLTFENDTIKEIFERGAISGCLAYNKWKSYSRPYIIVAVNDRILKGAVFGTTVQFSELYKGVNPDYLHSWFIQVQDRMYWQNGKQTPVGWDGYGDSYLLPPPDKDGMPIGTFMSYCQGRLVVFTEDNFAIVSDHIYGNGLKDTKGVEKFIEFQSQGDIGAIGTPSSIGEPTGAIAIPSIDTINGQSLLLVFCTRGAYTLDLSGDRSEWQYRGIQNEALLGRGGASAYGITPANNDVWYQSTDGSISSYKFERSERDKSWGNTSLSREVEKYLSFTDRSYLRFVSMESINNRLLATCAIKLEPCDMGGAHRFGMGMVALDFDKGSTVNTKPGFSWDGLWTGIRPIQLLKLNVDDAQRGFAVSHDDDGKNRIYEMLQSGRNDEVDGKKRKIVSFYHTPYLFEQQEPNEAPVLKKLIGAHAHVSDILDEVSISMEYRPDYYPEWTPLMKEKIMGCDDVEKDKHGNIVLPGYGKNHRAFKTTSVKGSCSLGVKGLSNVAYHYQLRVSITGAATVNLLQAQISPKQDFKENSCIEDTKRCEDINIEGENLFNYAVTDGI